MRLAGLRNWLGGGREAVQAAVLPALARAVGQPPPVPSDAPWTPLRLEIAESLWGDGCHWPELSGEVLRLAAPLGLSAASSVLLLGAGGGAPALRLAADLGAWVSGFEADPVLAAAARRLIKRDAPALAKRATVQSWDPAAPAFRPASFHHAIAVEALHGPQTVLAVAKALRPGGQLAVLETVAAASEPGPALRTWARLEHRGLPLPGSAWLTDPLERLGFEIRVSEDVSARHIREATSGWKQLVRALRSERPAPARAAVLVAEAELWLRRIALLRAGEIQVMRWHAIAPSHAATGVAA